MRRLVLLCFVLSLGCASSTAEEGTPRSQNGAPKSDIGTGAPAGGGSSGGGGVSDLPGNPNSGGGGGGSGGGAGGGTPGADAGGGTTPPPAPGTIELTLNADKGAASNAVVSTGVPFPPGALKDEANIAVKDAAMAEVPLQATVLARWPQDGSIRSVLLAFKASLASGATAKYRVDYGAPRTTAALTNIAPNPDGPIAAILPAKWYSASKVSGRLVPVAENVRFKQYDTQLEQSLWAINYSNYAVNCPTTSQHRTYYDGPHSLYQFFLRAGDAKHFRRAREEALWYRANELTWYSGRAMAVQSCQSSGWTPSVTIDQGVLRRMLGQGMLDDYLLTGDPAAKEAVLALGEAYRQDLPALSGGGNPLIENTERNLAWPMMGLDSYYALDQREEVKDALTSLMDHVVEWQGRGTSGALEHDIMHADPSECEDGPKGGSPFMTSLVVDGIMDYFALTGDMRAKDVVTKMAVWFETKAITSDHQAFRYLWNCTTDDYDDSGVADLNLLIVHVFGAAYALTSDKHWLAFGDTIADSGVDAMAAKAPKQWDQAARSFGRYLGYRSVGATP